MGLTVVEKTEFVAGARGLRPRNDLLEVPCVEDATRKEFLLGAAGLVLLTPYGCGQRAGDGDGEAGGTRSFEDDAGNVVEIPARPERVVALDDRTVEAALAVGAPVVGAVGRYEKQLVPPAFEELARGVEVVGETPNLEAIARLEPDLILAQGYTVEEIEGELGQVAPVVVLEYWKDDSYTTTKWEEHLRRVADAAGRERRAEEELRRLDLAVDSFREDFEGDPAEVELSVLQLQPEQWLYFTEVAFCGEIVDRLGFSRPKSQRDTDTDRVYLSYERLSLADGDAIVLTAETLEEGVSESVEEVTASPLWRSLGAVEAGEVHRADGFLWLTGGSVPAGLAIIADLRAAFIA